MQDSSRILHHPQPLPAAEGDTLPNIVASELNSITIAYSNNGGNSGNAAADFPMTPDYYPSDTLLNILLDRPGSDLSYQSSPSSSSSSHPSSPGEIPGGSVYADISYCFKQQQQQGYGSGMDDSGNESNEAEDNGGADPDYVPEPRKTTLCRCGTIGALVGLQI